MSDLLSRLQSATGGSRDLDQAIWEFIGRPGDDDPRLYAFEHGDCPLHYTTNLQDAVSLVGDDVEDVKLHIKRGELSSAMIRLRGDAEPFWGKHYKLPMAICEAIIKAHESKAEAA